MKKCCRHSSVLHHAHFTINISLQTSQIESFTMSKQYSTGFSNLGGSPFKYPLLYQAYLKTFLNLGENN